MLDLVKQVSIMFTAAGIGVTGWLQYEKFRVDGEWIIDTCTLETEFTAYQDLHLAWRVFLSDDSLGAPVVGDGEKVEEAFAMIPSRARFPVRLIGTKEIDRVTLTARFEGSQRASTGRFELHPTTSPRQWSGYLPFYQRNVDVMEGTFTFTAGNARGTALARRVGTYDRKAEPFECGAGPQVVQDEVVEDIAEAIEIENDAPAPEEAPIMESTE